MKRSMGKSSRNRKRRRTKDVVVSYRNIKEGEPERDYQALVSTAFTAVSKQI